MSNVFETKSMSSRVAPTEKNALC